VNVTHRWLLSRCQVTTFAKQNRELMKQHERAQYPSAFKPTFPGKPPLGTGINRSGNAPGSARPTSVINPNNSGLCRSLPEMGPVIFSFQKENEGLFSVRNFFERRNFLKEISNWR